MQSFQTFLDSFANHGAMILMVFILAFLFIRRVSELTMIGWNGFLDSLNRSGGHNPCRNLYNVGRDSDAENNAL